MSRASLVASVVLVLLASACIKHPPETTTVQRPDGPVAEEQDADTSATYLVVNREWKDGEFWEVKADTTECHDSRSECLEEHEGKIERTVLTIRPEEAASETVYLKGGTYYCRDEEPCSDELLRVLRRGSWRSDRPEALNLGIPYQPNWSGLQMQIGRLRDRAAEASLNGNWGLANELDAQAFWLQYELDRLRWE